MANSASTPAYARNEEGRLAALKRYSILDTLPEQIYEDATALASLIFSTPMALVSFVDADRQWFKSEVGVGLRETPRSVSFCAHTLGTATTLIIHDATQDDRFKDNPAVVGPSTSASMPAHHSSNRMDMFWARSVLSIPSLVCRPSSRSLP